MFFQDASQPRALLRAGMLCLATALCLRYFIYSSTLSGLNPLHFACGMLVGLSLELNLRAAWLDSRQRRCQAS